MTVVVGRAPDADSGGAVAELGAYLALDGSAGAALNLDVDRPHAALVVGKRGYGKTHTLGVLAEALARAPGVAPVVVDTVGVLGGLVEDSRAAPVPAMVVDRPTVAPAALDPRSWCALLDLPPESGPGSLVWRAAATAETLEGMRAAVREADAADAAVRSATNHLDLAAAWGVFAPDGLDAGALSGSEATVVDVSGLDAAPANAVIRAIAEGLYRYRVDGDGGRLPWLLVDEAHLPFEGVAGPGLETILRRGRSPGVSLVAATQRPGRLPDVAVSQADLLVAHRLTSRADLEALSAARPTYMDGTLVDRMPTEPGEVVVVDDATERVHTATVRDRHTPDYGGTPRASEVETGPD